MQLAHALQSVVELCGRILRLGHREVLPAF
jgi:hypothetical protein